jgi:hypothetical protein
MIYLRDMFLLYLKFQFMHLMLEFVLYILLKFEFKNRVEFKLGKKKIKNKETK